MSLAVFWSDEATETFDSIVLFIEYKWSEKQASVFVRHTEKILSLIREQPYMYKSSIEIMSGMWLLRNKPQCFTKSMMVI